MRTRGALPALLATCFSQHLTLTATAFSFNVGQARAGSRASNTNHAMSKMDQSFPTWSFDESCKTMAWTEMVSASLSMTTNTDKWEEDADLVLVGVFAPKQEEDELEKDEEVTVEVELSGKAKELDDKLGGALSCVISENAKSFKHGAKAGSTTPTLRLFSEGKLRRYAVVGLGQAEAKDGLLGVGSALGNALASKCNDENKVATAKVLLPEAFGAEASVMTDIASSFYENLYSDNRFRTGDKIQKAAEFLESVTFVSEASSTDGVEAALDAGKKLATGIYMAKDIVNAPHNVLNSESLAETAVRIAKESGGTLKCTILGKKECEERGMGAYLGVARGSETQPQFIHLTYTPPDNIINKKVGIIGKG
jgi:leucyl aminopeptidase